MSRTSRARRHAAALVGTAALVAGPLATSATAAEAPRPGKPTKAGTQAHGGGTAHLLRTVAGKDRRLARLAASTAVTRLDDTYEVEVVAGIEKSRATLAAIGTDLEAADSTLDVKAAAKDLRAFRVENHRLVVNVVAKADRLVDAATLAADTAAATAGATAIEAALAVTATSPKRELRAARAALRAARAEAEDTEDTAPVS